MIKETLKKSANPKKARILKSFFKTGTGEYGEGDIFIGITVPEIRRIARQFQALDITLTEKLLSCAIHEERVCALFILIQHYEKSDPATRQKIVELYLKNTRHINNWDLVDLSAYKILGNWLLNKPRAESLELRAKAKTHKPKNVPTLSSMLYALSSPDPRQVLYLLARSTNLWERRIAIVATFAFIRKEDLDNTFQLSDILLNDTEDLMHKAVGWMLREAGNRNQKTLEDFLKSRYKKMPRTMLRYAIERFPKDLYQDYLKGRI